MNKDRKSGYYWVQLANEWFIADYDQEDDSWFMDGAFWIDREFQQIDENQITR